MAGVLGGSLTTTGITGSSAGPWARGPLFRRAIEAPARSAMTHVRAREYDPEEWESWGR